jgi:hypothetical protein
MPLHIAPGVLSVAALAVTLRLAVSSNYRPSFDPVRPWIGSCGWYLEKLIVRNYFSLQSVYSSNLFVQLHHRSLLANV